MLKKSFKLLFQIFVVFMFLSASTYALLAAYGYQIDLLHQSIVKTSIIDITDEYEGANVYINGELKADKLPYQIKNIKPGIHELKIAKDEHVEWARKVEVKEDIVSLVNDVLLVPLNISEVFISFSVENDYEEVIQILNSYYFISKENNEIFAFRLNDNDAFDVEKINYLFKEIDIHKIYPIGHDNLVFSNTNELKILNVKNKTTLPIKIPNEFSEFTLTYTPNLNAFYLNGDNLYVAEISDEDGTISKITLLFESIIPGKDAKLDVINAEGNIFIKVGDYVFHYINGDLLFVDRDIILLPEVSPDGRFLTYTKSNGTIVSYSTANQTKKLLARFSQRIDDLQWFSDSKHLFMEQQRVVTICDLDFSNCSKILKLEDGEEFHVLKNSPFISVLSDGEIKLYEL